MSKTTETFGLTPPDDAHDTVKFLKGLIFTLLALLLKLQKHFKWVHSLLGPPGPGVGKTGLPLSSVVWSERRRRC